MSLAESGPQHELSTPITLEELEEKIEGLEIRARDAAGQRLHSVGTAISKIGVGGILAIDSVHPIFHLWGQQDKSEILGLIVGAAVVAWGFTDAGNATYDFVKARELCNQVTKLRTALSDRYINAINGRPDSEFTRII